MHMVVVCTWESRHKKKAIKFTPWYHLTGLFIFSRDVNMGLNLFSIELDSKSVAKAYVAKDVS